MRILLVEDDQGLADLLKQSLQKHHYLVEVVNDGLIGWEMAEAFEYDLILLDLGLPSLDGIRFCKQLRGKNDQTAVALNKHTPVILLTGLDVSTSKVAGLDAGADDYVVKPFDLDELLARIRALIRRGGGTLAPVLQWGQLMLDPNSCDVRFNEQPLHLTAKEYALLELFLRNSQRIFSQGALIEQLWSADEIPTESAVRTHIKCLRQKLKQVGVGEPIETVYGLGYRLRSPHALPDPSLPTDPQPNGQGAIAPPFRPANIPLSPLPPDRSADESHAASRATDVTDVAMELNSIWERHRASYLSRLAIVAEAIEAIATGHFDSERHQPAIREAHTLAGSLGSFGLGRASQLARHIEQALQSVEALTEAQIQQLQATVAEVEQAIASPSASVSDTVSTSVCDTVSAESAPTGLPVTLPSALPRHLSPSAVHATLLIVDDDPTFIHGVSIAAIAHSITTQSATSHAEARRVIRGARPDVVLLDLSLPNASEDGMALLHELTSQTPPIPVVVFTATEQFADRIKVARMGGQGFLHKPITPADAVGAIAQVLHQVERPDAKLLIVDDDPALLDFLRTLLNPWGFRLSLLDDPQQFWHTLEQFQPDLLILDIEMPSFSGIDLCRVVRNDPRWSDLPVLFLSVHTDAQTLTAVFSAGADDYVTKPIVGPELIARILNRLERTQILRQLGRYGTPKF